MLSYRGYTAEIKVDVDAGILVGKVLDIKDAITFQGATVEDARQEFQKSVDAYLQFCEELGQSPDKPFSGKLPFRTTPEHHRAIYLAATKAEKSINAWMEAVLSREAQAHLAGALANQEPSPSVKALLDRKNGDTELIAALSPYLARQDGGSIEAFLDATERLLTSLDGLRPFLKSDDQGSLVPVIEQIESLLSQIAAGGPPEGEDFLHPSEPHLPGAATDAAADFSTRPESFT
ncbi:MAG: type II toxin-antitoxin system HicB family antitoxin [Synechococcales bacterium]|nr:type II toxin-antitoxin system HicB family antitoxin [Synechococcales bacterium]